MLEFSQVYVVLHVVVISVLKWIAICLQIYLFHLKEEVESINIVNSILNIATGKMMLYHPPYICQDVNICQ